MTAEERYRYVRSHMERFDSNMLFKAMNHYEDQIKQIENKTCPIKYPYYGVLMRLYFAICVDILKERKVITITPCLNPNDKAA